MAGKLWGWGTNSFGELGDNTTVSKSSPIQTITYGSNWVSVVCGFYHTAAIKTDGTLWVWARNNSGQLGDNTIVNKSSPIQTITGGNNWRLVACGVEHTTGIKNDGTLWIWGFNSSGQLGDNSITNKSSPIQTIAYGTNWSFVACGGSTTAAIKTDGTLWMWGSNLYGQLGDNTIISKSSPIQTIAYGSNWSSVALGDTYAAAIKTDGTLWMWGYNGQGQLGDNTTVAKSSPIQTIAGGNNWSFVACGGAITAAIKTDGTLWNWGSNLYGQLGDNTIISKSSPIQTIAGGNSWSSVVLGLFHVAAIKTDGTLWTCGRSNTGQLGDNTIISKSSPIQTIAYGNNWSFVAGGRQYTAAIFENDANQLGINTQPLAGYNSNQLLVQPKININDSAGSLVRIATNSVTVAVQSGTATLSGTTTVTAVNGVATFTDLVLTGTGAVTLRFTSSGLTLVDSSSFTVSLTLPIIPKRSEVSDRIPTSGQLNIGELAINIDDRRGYVKKSDGTILNIFNGEIADGGTF